MPVYYNIPLYADGITFFGSEQLIKTVVSDYLATDVTLMSWLGAGQASILEDGTFTQDTLTPVVQMHFTGSGDVAGGLDTKINRFILHVINRNRGYAEIARIIERMRFLINSPTLSPSFRDFATFNPAVTPYSIVHAKAAGQTSNITMNRYEAVAIGMYLQVYMRGYPVN